MAEVHLRPINIHPSTSLIIIYVIEIEIHYLFCVRAINNRFEPKKKKDWIEIDWLSISLAYPNRRAESRFRFECTVRASPKTPLGQPCPALNNSSYNIISSPHHAQKIKVRHNHIHFGSSVLNLFIIYPKKRIVPHFQN